ncbi:unnamed protein product [Aphanomyces euteiches]
MKKHEQLKKTFTLIGLNKRAGMPQGLVNSIGHENYTKKSLLDADLSILFTRNSKTHVKPDVNSMGQIYTLNQQLLDHLTRHLKETESYINPVHRGAIFNAYALFQMYSSYACYHDTALATIESNRFKSMLEEIQLHMDEPTLHRLRTYLNMPMESTRTPDITLFYVEYKVNGLEHYDNNCGMNYQVITPTSASESMKSSPPITPLQLSL